ncbi:MAG: tRNA pseudouridine(38-40) synthase TruA [Deltaproteobacteria bacterium]|nr:tRNA pseudouridine(38-40) synthase TruA [Deltaproteobacteria bacterium]
MRQDSAQVNGQSAGRYPTHAHDGRPLENMALVIAYEGGPFMGWQVQPHGESVQGQLEQALATITRLRVGVVGAGRTDSGVHALGQVANIRLPAGTDQLALLKSLNGLLAPHISVRGIIPVEWGFHARHSARGKVYRYHIQNKVYPAAFSRDHSWWLKSALDVSAMRAGAEHLLGTHDFSSFRARHCEAPTTVRTLSRIELTEGDWPDSTLRLEIEGNAFLQHMVRIITGTLVAVGKGRLAPDGVRGILESCSRDAAFATAPARGLHLLKVFYDPPLSEREGAGGLSTGERRDG